MAEANAPHFDKYADEYDAALAQGLSVSGEDKNFFAAGRTDWLTKRLQELNATPSSILDFGCGTGSATPHLLGLPHIRSLIGVDISARSIAQARATHPSDRSTFTTLDAFAPTATIDLAFCNGVFHHIPPEQRGAAARLVHDAVRTGGLFAFCENNPWNPGTRYVMRRIPFDRDAILLWPRQARQLLRSVGFVPLHTDFLFIFPRWLAPLRWLEPHLARWPLGGQYMVICQKP